MAQKKQTIVIKKIIVQGGGHHGGSWKVALADFMTAMMAFFLVMWLLGQNEETKKAVSDYFSTPSVIEYNFQNFGAEITLEKLFLDLVNEPLKAFQSFLEPADKTPNILDMGSQKVVAAFMADKMTDVSKNVSISQDGFNFDIPDNKLFIKGTANPTPQFIEIMEKLSMITSGLQDSEIKIVSALFTQAVQDQTEITAKKVAHDRLALVTNKIRASFEHSSNIIAGSTLVKEKKGDFVPEKLIGFIRFSIHQVNSNDETKNRRKLETIFEKDKKTKDSNETPDRKMLDGKKLVEQPQNAIQLINPVDIEVQKAQHEANPHPRAEEETDLDHETSQ